MKRLVLGLLLSATTGCGPSYGGQDVKTPDQLIADQEAQGAEDEKKKKAQGDDYDLGTPDQTEDEKRRQWDEKQADLELKRAARSAETCPGSVTEKTPKGTATVNLVFQNDGHVKSKDITAPYAGTPVGDCVLNAMGAIIVPAFEGAEHPVTWEIDLSGKVAEEPVKPGTKKK